MRRVWRIRPVDELLVSRLAQTLDLPRIIAEVLFHRGAVSASEAADFLLSDLSSLPDPARMLNLEKAVHLIRQALSRKEKIIVVGDYDVDGLTSTAILIRVLRGLGGDLSWHIPHRMTDGYGLKAPVIREAAGKGVKLLMTVDCGTTSFKELALAKQLGMETVVVDHHELSPEGKPPASALLNPLQEDCGYPNKGLASVGVAFTLARGLLMNSVPGTAFDHLDLVALGTIADLSPLVGENRVLVKAGLHRLQGTRKVGLRALLSQSRMDGRRLTAEDVSFTLAPRLNAMGRLGSAELSLELLITEDPVRAQSIVKSMAQQNKARAAFEREAFRRALSKVEREVNFARERVIVLEDERMNPGVAGIIATRLTHRFHRPTVAIALNGPVCRGSARSIPAFPLLEAFEQVKEHLLEFGGHSAAAGLTIAREQIGPFRQALNRVAQERIDPQMLTPSLDVDAHLPLASLTDDFMRDLELLAPFGIGNPRPIFVSEDARIPLERKETEFSPFGIRFQVEDGQGRLFMVLQPRQNLEEGWNLRRLRGGPVNLAYSPIQRREGDSLRLELRLHDLKLP
ncbi:MAG: single-stranded-DNA-specific exonuclease RecJ [Candidatus Omnitrophica bacterium]|nr:single-stranded-DNA-specific exonuclease RecJ [Candidatus Omnitrophota bacterium]